MLATLLLAPAGAIILGQRRAALISFAADLVALALMVAGAALAMLPLFGLALAVALTVRVNQIVHVGRMPLPSNPPSARHAVPLIVGVILVVELIAHSARHWVVEGFKIASGSMIPALQVGDHFYVDKRATSPARGDVVVFRSPRQPDFDYVERVIGIGGDTVEMADAQLLLNGQPVAHRSVDGPCSYRDYDAETQRWDTRACDAYDETIDGRTWRIYRGGDPPMPPQTRWTVPPGHYFVMGDNRDNSLDSRYWGFVPSENVKGTAHWIWWSTGPDGIRSERIGEPVK